MDVDVQPSAALARDQGRWLVSLCICVAALLLAALLAEALSSSTAGQSWQAALTHAVDPLGDGVWHLMRGALAYLAIPGLLGILIVGLARAWGTGSWPEFWAAGALVLGANATIQAIKHLQLTFVGADNNLSGHIGVATATCLALMLVVPQSGRQVATWCAWAFLSVFSIAILLSRWHSLCEILVPMFVCAAWGLAVLGALGALSRGTSAPTSASQRRPGGSRYLWWLVVGGAALMIGVGAAAWLGWVEQWSTAEVGGALAGAILVIIGASAVTVGSFAVFLPRSKPADSTSAAAGG